MRPKAGTRPTPTAFKPILLSQPSSRHRDREQTARTTKSFSEGTMLLQR